MGEYDTETDPDCIEYEDDKDCNDPPFDSAVTSNFSPQRIHAFTVVYHNCDLVS